MSTYSAEILGYLTRSITQIRKLDWQMRRISNDQGGTEGAFTEISVIWAQILRK